MNTETKISPEAMECASDWFNDGTGITLAPMASVNALAEMVQQAIDKAMVPLQEKLDFLKSKGLTVGKLKTSDKPEPYLAYVIEPDSELCDLKTVNKLIDAERELARLKADAEKIQTVLNSVAVVSVESLRDRYMDSLEKFNREHLPETYESWEKVWEHQRNIKKENEQLKSEIEELRKDKERLDWIESKSDGSSCIARMSDTGRGFRLHNTGRDDSMWPDTRATFRDAIDAAMKGQP